MAPSNFPARTWQLRMDDGGAAGYGFSIAAADNRILYLNNNNRVGINEVSPDATFHVTGADGIRNERAGAGVYDMSIDNTVTGDAADLNFIAQTNDTGYHFRVRKSNANLVSALTMNSDGHVGIGTTNPTIHGAGVCLDVGGGTNADPTILIDSGSSGDPRLYFDTTGANRSCLIKFLDQGTVIGGIQYNHNGDKMLFQSGSSTGTTFTVGNYSIVMNGEIRIEGNNLLQFDGGVYHRFKRDGNQLHLLRGDTLAQIGYWNDVGAYTATSDSRLKENITTITGATAKLKQLRGVTHTWKPVMQNPDNPATVSYGLIAQEVEAVIPEVVSTGANEDAYKGIQYDNLIPLLIETIKELEARITSLE